jgi:hypothetical protein
VLPVSAGIPFFVFDAIDELGFEIAFIDGKPNYVLYPIRMDT